MNQEEIEEFEKWVKMWPFAQNCTESVLRKITRGPMAKVFSEFFVKKCRSDEWIDTANSNFFVQDHKENEESGVAYEESEQATRDHEAEMAEMQQQYDVLCLKEEKLIQEAFEKQKKVPRRHRKGKGSLSKGDLQMVQEVNRRYAEIAERKATELGQRMQKKISGNKPTSPSTEVSREQKATKFNKLDLLQADIVKRYSAALATKHDLGSDKPVESSKLIEDNNAADLERRMLDVLKSDIRPVEIKEWIQESRLKSFEKIKLRVKQEKEMPSIITIFEEKIASWSSLHLNLGNENQQLREEILKDEETIETILRENPEQLQLATLLIEEFKLNEELKFYENFEAESFVSLIEKKIAEIVVPDVSAELKDPVDESMEDQLIRVVTSWPHAKLQIQETQATTQRMFCDKIPKLCEVFNKYLESRIKDIEKGTLFDDGVGD